MSPKVSVIMPVYNGEDFIVESLDSIKNQSYLYWECIIFNDNSLDASEDIILDFIKNDNRFVYIKSDENVGAAQARNRCIDVAKGKYIAILDCDDLAMTDRFMKQVHFLDNEKMYGFVGSNVMYFENQEKEFMGTFKNKDIQKKDFRSGMPLVHSTLLIKKEILDDIGGYPNYRRVQDYAMLMNASSQGYIGHIIDDVLVKYRIDKDNYRRRTLKSRFTEVKIRINGYKNMKYPKIYYIYIFKPILSALIPVTLMKEYHKRKW